MVKSRARLSGWGRRWAANLWKVEGGGLGLAVGSDLSTSRTPAPPAAVGHFPRAERIHPHELRRLGYSMSLIGQTKRQSTVRRELRRNRHADRG